jgi:hypothetical protein
LAADGPAVFQRVLHIHHASSCLSTDGRASTRPLSTAAPYIASERGGADVWEVPRLSRSGGGEGLPSWLLATARCTPPGRATHKSSGPAIWQPLCAPDRTCGETPCNSTTRRAKSTALRRAPWLPQRLRRAPAPDSYYSSVPSSPALRLHPRAGLSAHHLSPRACHAGCACARARARSNQSLG